MNYRLLIYILGVNTKSSVYGIKNLDKFIGISLLSILDFKSELKIVFHDCMEPHIRTSQNR